MQSPRCSYSECRRRRRSCFGLETSYLTEISRNIRSEGQRMDAGCNIHLLLLLHPHRCSLALSLLLDLSIDRSVHRLLRCPINGNEVCTGLTSKSGPQSITQIVSFSFPIPFASYRTSVAAATAEEEKEEAARTGNTWQRKKETDRSAASASGGLIQ